MNDFPHAMEFWILLTSSHLESGRPFFRMASSGPVTQRPKEEVQRKEVTGLSLIQ